MFTLLSPAAPRCLVTEEKEVSPEMYTSAQSRSMADQPSKSWTRPPLPVIVGRHGSASSKVSVVIVVQILLDILLKSL